MHFNVTMKQKKKKKNYDQNYDLVDGQVPLGSLSASNPIPHSSPPPLISMGLFIQICFRKIAQSEHKKAYSVFHNIYTWHLSFLPL